MEPPTKGIGSRISNMGEAWRLGLMVPCMKEAIRMGRRTVKVNFSSRMALSTPVTFSKMKSQAMACTCGQTVKLIKATG